MSRVLLTAALLLAFAVPVRAAAQTSPWPQFGGANGHNSYAADPNITASGSPSLGVQWMANLYSADMGSPVVAYNATLGMNVVYVGNERGDVFAINASNGQPLWSTNLGINDAVRATPAVAPDDGSVWVGTAYNPTVYKLNGATGAIECSRKTALLIDASPMIATPPGGTETVYVDTVDSSSASGPTAAINESDCSQSFSFTGYNSIAGVWGTPAFGLSAGNEPLVLVGTGDPDETEYAIDGTTGQLVWNFSTFASAGDYDIGDAATISPPGNNGFADGVAYFSSKHGIEYAVDLTSGVDLWQFNLCSNICEARSGSALDANTLVFGYFGGVYALNASTGAEIWKYTTPAEVISSPAIIGPPGNEVVAFGDVTGTFRVLNLSTGALLYSYKTGGYITSSPADNNGSIVIASTDGFLYSYAIAGGTGSPPSTTISAPANLSKASNPNGNFAVTGTSTDSSGVSAVEVALQVNGSAGLWYNAATGTFNSAPVRNPATLDNPGATSTTWSFQFPAPPGGGSYRVYANTVNAAHLVDRGTNTAFSILPSTSEPSLTVKKGYAGPGGSFSVTGHVFQPGETVSFSLFGNAVASATAATNGYVPYTRIPVPNNPTFGPTTITAVGQSSGLTSTVAVDVTNEWTQLGATANRLNMTSHDNIINNTIIISGSTLLGLSWYYPAGAPVNSSPAVVDGVVYFGNDAGVLSAVLTNSGAPLWTYTTPTGAPIRSAPAVDPSGPVVFGANDGNLYILSGSGALTSTTPLGGNLGSPSLANGQIYVGSDNGNLYNIEESNGTIRWQSTLPGALHAAPSYDFKAGIVVTGDDSGAITAFNATTGAELWQVTTGGAVTGSPVIVNGSVFAGSQDGNMYALNESTGATVWKDQSDGPIVAGAAFTGTLNTGTPNIAWGTQKGTLYLAATTTGALLYTQSGAYKNSPIVGVGANGGYLFAETASGFIGGTRRTGGLPTLGWGTQTGSTLSTAPAIIDGTLYVSANDGGVYAFSPHGSNPVPASRHSPIITITNQPWTCTTR